MAGSTRAALDAIGAAPRDVVMARLYIVDLTPEWMDEGVPLLMEVFDRASRV